MQIVANPMTLDRDGLRIDPCATESAFHEHAYHHPQDDFGTNGQVSISRWINTDATPRYEEMTTPSNRCVISVALRPTKLTIARDGQPIFDGRMPAGALHIAGPRVLTGVHFRAPFEFLHLHVDADLFSPSGDTVASPKFEAGGMIVVRDAFAEKVARLLDDHRNNQDGVVLLRLGQALAAYVAQLQPSQRSATGLPKWRLKRVEDYSEANFHRGIGLAEMAKAAGLSRMHFAAQFRVTMGYRPHEYLLRLRIERAKALLAETNMPLAEIAISVGFSTQAHFSSVFKRIADKTPARWRCANKRELRTVAAER